MSLREILLQAESQAPAAFGENHKVSANPVVTPEYAAWRDQKFGLVEIKTPIDHQECLSEAPLLRFMELPKLLDLLTSCRLRLPQLSKLMEDDPFECNLKPNDPELQESLLRQRILKLKEYAPQFFHPGFGESFSRAILGQATNSFESIVERMQLKDLKEAAWFLEHSRLKQELWCNCWYGSRDESHAMWKIYCGQMGVALVTSVPRLKSAISCSVPRLFAQHFRLGLAKIDYETGKNTKPWLMKRKAFRHEDEIRLFVDYPEKVRSFTLKVELEKLVEKIIVTPFARKWEYRAIEETIKKFGQFKIEHSKLLDGTHPTWPVGSSTNELGESS